MQVLREWIGRAALRTDADYLDRWMRTLPKPWTAAMMAFGLTAS
jgi:hypothetical protein